jgi:hypothetical protein
MTIKEALAFSRAAINENARRLKPSERQDYYDALTVECGALAELAADLTDTDNSGEDD